MHDPAHSRSTFWRSRSGIALLVFGAVAGFLLLVEHRAHALGALPYLLILACPLMHMFMHGGHSHGHSGHQHPEESERPAREKPDAR